MRYLTTSGSKKSLDTANHETDPKALIGSLEEAFSANTVKHWITKLREGNIKCAPSRSIRKIHEDAQANYNGLTTETTSFNLGKIKLQGLPFKFSRTPGKLELPAPAHGQHTEVVLSQLGYSCDQITDLKNRQVVG